jgi:hypothetical protein
MTVLVLTTTSMPAQAERTTVSDEVDAFALDVTRFRISNRDRAIVVKLTFAQDAPGAISVGIGTRHRSGVTINSEHRRRGPDKTYLSEGRCKGLTSDWQRRAAKLNLRMPDRCLHNGNYGAVRGQTITFVPRFIQDVDFAPDLTNGADTYTKWASRG